MAQSVQLFLLAGCAFAFAGSLLSAAIVRGSSSRLAALEPRARHRALALIAGLPLASAGALLFAVSLPSLLALANPAWRHWDHCLSHDDGHAHLCFVHLPTAAMNVALQLGLVFIVSYTALRAALSAASMVRATRVLRALAKTGLRADTGVTVLETPLPLCFAAGLLRPTVLISRGLLNSLSDDERFIALTHERAHVRRRDALTASYARTCAALHLPGVGRWLVQELSIAAEQVCDEEAAAAIGDRVAVAATILAVERAAREAGANGQLRSVAVALGVCGVERRVEALLAEPKAAAKLAPFYCGLAFAGLALLLASGPLHHATETALSYIAH